MPALTKRWSFIICPDVPSPLNKGNTSIKLTQNCRDCRFFKGFYETGVKCNHDYMIWCEKQGIDP